LGLVFVNLINPGSDGLSQELSAKAGEFAHVQQQLSSQKLNTISDLLLQIIPSNILHAMAEGQMLALIFFSLLFGYAITKIESHNSATLRSFWQGIFQTMIHITHMIMKILPFGVFFLVAKVFATTGFESLKSLLIFFITVILALASCSSSCRSSLN
jgi:Na+/H+-dicarboxylate symporter